MSARIRARENMAMINSRASLLVAALMLGAVPVWAQPPGDVGTLPGVDHSQMDHSKMGHGSAPPTEETMRATEQGGRMFDHSSMQGGPPPPDARDPHAYSGGYTLDPARPLRLADEQMFGSFMVDRFESVRTSGNSFTTYELLGRFGRDYDRAVLKAEGEVDGGKLHDARTELLWGHAVAAYWDTQLGMRYDSGLKPDRRWLAFGIQGLAPYWFEVDATAYVGEQGRTALRLDAEYELLLTQKLILQPRFEVNFYGKSDAQRERGSGLSDAALGLRLRYEIRREFAPYIGIERSNKYGGSADFARAEGQRTSESRVVAGLRFWF